MVFMILILAFSSLVVRFHAIYFALSGRDQTLQYISFQSENFALSRIRLSVSIILKCSSSYRIATVSIILQKPPLSIFIFHALLMAYVKEQRIWQKPKRATAPQFQEKVGEYHLHRQSPPPRRNHRGNCAGYSGRSSFWARQKILCKSRQAVVKETGANQRISLAGHNPA